MSTAKCSDSSLGGWTINLQAKIKVIARGVALLSDTNNRNQESLANHLFSYKSLDVIANKYYYSSHFQVSINEQ